MSSVTISVSTVSSPPVSLRPLHPYVVDASFAENFYGLKRRRRPFIETERARAAVGDLPMEEKLRDREVWRSLLVLVRGSHDAEIIPSCFDRSPSLIFVPRLKVTTRTLVEEQMYLTMVRGKCRRSVKR
jgi:hypothetical protein